MSAWRFWGTKQKKDKEAKDPSEQSLDTILEAVDDGEVGSMESSPSLDRQRNRHQLSVSRSGRYRQRQRKRSGILDRPDFVRSAPLQADGKDPDDGGNGTLSQNGTPEDSYQCGHRNCDLEERRQDFRVVAL